VRPEEKVIPLPYICGECHKSGGGRSRRSHGGGKKAGKRRSKYAACLSREMKRTKAPDQATKMHLVQNACGRYRKKGKK
jgi:hypothetical protein